MVPRLVNDALWRNRWGYFTFIPIQLLFWLLFDGRIHSMPLSLAAASMIGAAMLGPMFAVSAMGLRELRHLPVNARDVWRASWFIATVVPVGMLLTTKTIAFVLVTAYGGRTEITAEGALLSVVFDFMWASVVLLMLPLLGYASNAGARHGAVMSSLAGAAAIVGVLAGFAAPLLISDALPVRVSDFTPATLGLLIAGLAVAVVAIVWTPTRGVLAGERPQVQTKRGSLLPGAARRPRFSDRLTGISRVVVPHLLATLALALVACLGMVAYGLVSGSGPWWFVPPTPEVFDPGGEGQRGLTYFVLLPCMVAVGVSIWTPWTRLLKVLPVSAKQINAMLVISPFATWAILWVLGYSAYVLAYGTPQILRIEFALGMAALTALVHAALLRVQGGAGTLWVLIAMGALLPQIVKVGLRGEIASQIAFALMGTVALCAAAFINHRTLTRSTSSSRSYCQPQPPFGISTTARIR